MSRFTLEEIAEQHRGKTIAILGNGPTVIYKDDEGAIVGKADFSAYPNPIWAINGGWHYHPQATLGFLMDDVKGPATDEHPDPPWYIDLVRVAKIPILTTREYSDFPALVRYPLEDTLRFFKRAYFAESINYMIAFATMIGVESIDFFGADYIGSRPQERASVEYWCGTAHGLWIARQHLEQMARRDPEFAAHLARASREHGVGIDKVGAYPNVSEQSSLMKADSPESFYMPGFYGYSREAFPLKWKTAGPNPNRVQVGLDDRFEMQWWREHDEAGPRGSGGSGVHQDFPSTLAQEPVAPPLEGAACPA